MNPYVMGLILVAALTAFGFSVCRRWRLMMVGSGELKFDQIGRRLRLTLRYAFGQTRLMRYRLAGIAHKAIFFGFLVLLLRILILFGRGFVDDPTFGFWAFDSGTLLGDLYALIKDVCIVLVILGALVFVYLRIVVKLLRMTLSTEGLLILAIILLMMFADVTYDAAGHVLASRDSASTVATAPSFDWWQPLGSSMALPIAPLSTPSLTILLHLSFWAHVGLVLLFLNILPYSKHFHVITAVPNIFFQSLEPAGRLRPIEDIEGRIERDETLGVRRINELSTKGILDLYTCTECGRCTDQCPASNTGKLLSPQQLTVDLRNHLYSNQSKLLTAPSSVEDIVPAVIDPEVLWACTTCGACEQECPVFISYVDKIVDLRRHLVLERGEVPAALESTFQNLEMTGSPYGVSSDERLQWVDGLDVPVRADTDEVEILFWVGCAPAIDQRARGIARAMAQLLNAAGVKWAILGREESCTGDVARRAGNEYLFQTMVRANVETLGRYKVKKILTVCPHCYNTLKHEYPDFGGQYEVVHHTEYLAQLLAEGKLKPSKEVRARITYHDSCYLGRYNDLFDAPRNVLNAIPGVQLVEPAETRDRGMCCGAGGAQMFKEEEPGTQRVSEARTAQLLATQAEVISTACPFCMRMMTDALNTKDRVDVRQLDIAEVLLESVIGSET